MEEKMSKTMVNKIFCEFGDENDACLYQRADIASHKWYTRIRKKSGGYVIKSTKTENKQRALTIAEQIYNKFKEEEDDPAYKARNPRELSLRVARGNTNDPCGIYEIRNKQTNKTYVGFSNNITNRWRQHRGMLVRNKHKNPKLQRDWNKWGHWNFDWSVIKLYPQKTCTDFLKDEEERSILKKLRDGQAIYNSVRRG